MIIKWCSFSAEGFLSGLNTIEMHNFRFGLKESIVNNWKQSLLGEVWMKESIVNDWDYSFTKLDDIFYLPCVTDLQYSFFFRFFYRFFRPFFQL